MIVRIGRREFIEIVRDGRFRWSAAAVALLLAASLAMGWKHFSETSRQQRMAQEGSYSQWLQQGSRNPHSAAHFGDYAFRPLSPPSLMDSGLDPYLGRAVRLEAHYQNPARYRPAEDATSLQRFGQLTAAAVLQLLLPLLIMLLAFASFAGEREQGTLRQLLSLGLPGRPLALGKAAGISAALALLLIPSAFLGGAALVLASGFHDLADGMRRIAAMGVGYSLYLFGFVGLALLVSARSRTARSSLAVLLAFWICNGLLVPRLASDLSKNLYSTPEAEEFWSRVQHDIKQGIDGHDDSDERRQQLQREILEKYQVDKVEDLPVNFSGIAMQAGEEHGNQVFDRHYGELWKTYSKQERVHLAGALAAPLLAARAFSMGMAGTDLDHHRRFIEAAEGHRRLLNKTMNEYLAENSRSGDYFYFAGREAWELVPEFEYHAPDFSWALRQQAASLGLLVLWPLLTGGALVAAAGRIKP